MYSQLISSSFIILSFASACAIGPWGNGLDDYETLSRQELDSISVGRMQSCEAGSYNVPVNKCKEDEVVCKKKTAKMTVTLKVDVGTKKWVPIEVGAEGAISFTFDICDGCDGASTYTPPCENEIGSNPDSGRDGEILDTDLAECPEISIVPCKVFPTSVTHNFPVPAGIAQTIGVTSLPFTLVESCCKGDVMDWNGSESYVCGGGGSFTIVTDTCND